MPNHVHMILEINQAGGGAPPLQNVVRRFKTYTTKACVEISNSANATLWQRSFHEHIIRDEQDYNEIWGYIDTNPLK
jgi:putative transposase